MRRIDGWVGGQQLRTFRKRHVTFHSFFHTVNKKKLNESQIFQKHYWHAIQHICFQMQCQSVITLLCPKFIAPQQNAAYTHSWDQKVLQGSES
jgi:hypothetical protein